MTERESTRDVLNISRNINVIGCALLDMSYLYWDIELEA